MKVAPAAIGSENETVAEVVASPFVAAVTSKTSGFVKSLILTTVVNKGNLVSTVPFSIIFLIVTATECSEVLAYAFVKVKITVFPSFCSSAPLAATELASLNV